MILALNFLMQIKQSEVDAVTWNGLIKWTALMTKAGTSKEVMDLLLA